MNNGIHPRRTSPVKGQRLYGKLVVQILKQRGTITFDELVSELYKDVVHAGLDNLHADKNIRKRVYDVINVLSAIGMAHRDGKNIILTGDHPEEIQKKKRELEKEKQLLEESITNKREQHQDLLLQSIAYKSLLLTKKQKPNEPKTRIHLPFIVVKVNKDTEIQCEISNDKMQHLFTLDQPFEILDNMKVLQAMGLAFGLEKTNCTTDNLTMISKQL